MSLQYCTHCKTCHPPSDGYYWGPTWDCSSGEPEPEERDAVTRDAVEQLMAKVARLENAVWALQKKLGVEEDR